MNLNEDSLIPTDQVTQLKQLKQKISNCKECKDYIEPNPVLRIGYCAQLLVIGQAPGTKVHATGIPWNDASGQRLRKWLGLSPEEFYDTSKVAIMPMGFCYPGKGRSGDLPPRKECQQLWHDKLLALMPNIKSTLLIGQYAQHAYLPGRHKKLADNVRHWETWFPRLIPMPHPSPRNQLWLKQHAWFEDSIIPQIQTHIRQLLNEELTGS